ncbi:Uncharacterised protein [Vibrio cholerae]|nr:Uncharacterised protein [Vibrio cholerae]
MVLAKEASSKLNQKPNRAAPNKVTTVAPGIENAVRRTYTTK